MRIGRNFFLLVTVALVMITLTGCRSTIAKKEVGKLHELIEAIRMEYHGAPSYLGLEMKWAQFVPSSFEKTDDYLLSGWKEKIELSHIGVEGFKIIYRNVPAGKECEEFMLGITSLKSYFLIEEIQVNNVTIKGPTFNYNKKKLASICPLDSNPEHKTYDIVMILE
ncbi:type 4 pilus major pilin [Desulfoluna sp.]|uniref:type 4 pilus major pilin n=1 Tax=Desulfoluna sp. TaxID=2045199 RepID=UPI002606C831|nr:type 4 pilus major pilin [Desulfoluna sp.]